LKKQPKKIHEILSDEELKDCVLLVMDKKQDLSRAISLNEIAKKLRIERVKKNGQRNELLELHGKGSKKYWIGIRLSCKRNYDFNLKKKLQLNNKHFYFLMNK